MVTLPLDELRMEGEQLHTPLASTESGLKSRSAYDAAGFERIQGSQMVQIGGAVSMGEKAGSMAMGEHEPSAESTGFRTLDTNRDGYLSKEEANRSGLISGHWQQADTNDDGRLDRSEFSAFEAQESPGEGSMRMSPGKGAQGGEGMKESMQESMQESGGKY